jgi:MFS transporter, PHS family, inorganic phosphate transporter
LSFFFVNFGPNTTTFLIPSEIFPTAARATAHGISAASGKLGAFVGALCMPIIMDNYGLSTMFSVVAVICLLGIIVSLPLPEMKGKALEN